jgi:hypothetical protein
MVSQPNLNMYRPGSVTRPTLAQLTLLTAILSLRAILSFRGGGAGVRCEIHSVFAVFGLPGASPDRMAES